MFAFWKGGATEQVRDGFIKNKLAIQRSDCKLKRRKTFAVEADALARLPDIQRSFLSGDPPKMVPSRVMRKIVCRLRLNEVSRQ